MRYRNTRGIKTVPQYEYRAFHFGVPGVLYSRRVPRRSQAPTCIEYVRSTAVSCEYRNVMCGGTRGIRIWYKTRYSPT